MKCVFVDREREIQALNRAWRERPGFVVVYGRRRIGKTRLLVEWAEKRKAKKVYFLAHLTSHEHNLRLLAERGAKSLGDPLIEKIKPESLSSLLELFWRSGAELVVIDEFTYWARSSPRVLSELQEFIDTRLPHTNMLVVVSGSIVGVMKRVILAGGSPLYGRAGVRLKVEPLEYRYTKSFTPKWSSVERVKLYSIVGGIPFYLCIVAGSKSLKEALEKLILEPGAPLVGEKDFLLREEFREPHTYNAVLSAIARGYNTPAKIADVTGLDSSHVSKYLYTLEYIGLVERRTPLFSKKGRYRIKDPILRAWYTAVEPAAELIELGKHEEALERIQEGVDKLAALTWEELVAQYLLLKHAHKGYTEKGFLERKGEEIDVAILNKREKKLIIAEAKWSKLTIREAASLRRRAGLKASRLIPKEYTIEETYIAVRELAGGPKPEWVITPEDLESSMRRQ